MYVNLSENNTTYYMVLEEQEGSILADLCRVELFCGEKREKAIYFHALENTYLLVLGPGLI